MADESKIGLLIEAIELLVAAVESAAAGDRLRQGDALRAASALLKQARALL